MNLILSFNLHFFLLVSVGGNANVLNIRRGHLIKTRSWNMDFNTLDSTNTPKLSESHKEAETDKEKEFKYVVMKMLSIATNKNSCVCNCSDYVDMLSTTEETKILNENLKLSKRDKPDEYPEANNTISKKCPYFVANEGFRMEKMGGVFWSKFYSMRENMLCFKINVLQLSTMQKKRKEIAYGTFNGMLDWRRVHFEIEPPSKSSDIRHYLLGDDSDLGVMRNILIKAEDTGEFSLLEESPDQWLMLGKLALLRDCGTGEVVVFTRAPQMTTTEDIVLALQYLGENVVGKMLCDEDSDLAD